MAERPSYKRIFLLCVLMVTTTCLSLRMFSRLDWIATLQSPPFQRNVLRSLLEVKLIMLDLDEQSNRVFSSDELPDNEELNPSVANGFIGSRLYSDAIYISGVFNGDHLHSHRARLPSALLANIVVHDVSTKSVLHRYSLDTETATFYDEIKSVSGQWTIQHKVYAHRVMRNVLLSEIKVETYTTESLSFSINNQFGNGTDDFDCMSFRHNKDSSIWTGVTKVSDHPTTRKINVAMMWNSKTNQETFKISGNSSRQLIFATVIASDLDSHDPEAAVELHMQEVLGIHKKNPESLWQSHKEEWEVLWRDGSIDIVGDDNLAKAVYGSLYYIISSIRVDWPYGLSPGGLASDAYLGHTFWDQETWMYPNLLLLHNNLALSALMYRFNRLKVAQERARQHGYEGAMFPWESSFSGFEVCPEPVPYSKYEHHITGDIGFAVQQYWMATHDVETFKKFGLDMIQEIASFWVSRVKFNRSRKKYVINNVQGPDEYHYNVNNSVYTNAIAKINLNFAHNIFQLFGRKAPKAWKTIAAGLYIPYDTKLKYHPEYDNYKVNETVKQADVILLSYPLMMPMEPSARMNDLRIYEACTDRDGPAMTWSMFAIGWLECGKLEKASANFKQAYANVREPFKVWTETPSGGAVNFITGAGGFLQSVLFGYGGLRLREDRLEINPKLPSSTTELTINGVTYLGNKIAITYQDGETYAVIVFKQIKPAQNICITVTASGKSYRLPVGKRVQIIAQPAYFTKT